MEKNKKRLYIIIFVLAMVVFIALFIIWNLNKADETAKKVQLAGGGELTINMLNGYLDSYGHEGENLLLSEEQFKEAEPEGESIPIDFVLSAELQGLKHTYYFDADNGEPKNFLGDSYQWETAAYDDPDEEVTLEQVSTGESFKVPMDRGYLQLLIYQNDEPLAIHDTDFAESTMIKSKVGDKNAIATVLQDEYNSGRKCYRLYIELDDQGTKAELYADNVTEEYFLQLADAIAGGVGHTISK